MASTLPKRKRPAFSPPRPKTTPATTKAKSTSTSKSKAKNTPQSRARPPPSAKGLKKSRLVSPTPSLSSDSAPPTSSPPQSQSQSPAASETSEPDFILAEISAEDAPESTNSDPSIPLPLLHRLLHHHFHDKEKTRLTSDAKEVVGKYVEVFVREAIARSTFERQGEDGEGGGGGGGLDDGWLEVEDLEKTGVQLVLDF